MTDVSLLGDPMIAGGSLLQRRRGTAISVDMDTEFPFAACKLLEIHTGRFTGKPSDWITCGAPYRRIFGLGAVGQMWADGAEQPSKEVYLNEIGLYDVTMGCFNGGLIANEGVGIVVPCFDVKTGAQSPRKDGTTVKTRPAKNSFPFYERIVGVGATDGKHPIADNLIASIADTFFAEFGDCTTEDKTCTVYGQNFQAADMHQINEYWKRIGKPSFQERGWVVVNALTVFDSAYNKG